MKHSVNCVLTVSHTVVSKDDGTLLHSWFLVFTPNKTVNEAEATKCTSNAAYYCNTVRHSSDSSE